MRKPCKEFSLAFLSPELVKLWHPTRNGKLTPYDVTCNSHKEVSWKCKSNHEWVSSVREQNRKQKCPKCNSFAFAYPDLAKEWNYAKNGSLTPFDVTCGSSKKFLWTCQNNHEYLSSPNFRSHGRRCPYCFGYKVCKDNCLSTTNPKLIKEWDYEKNYPLTPEDVNQRSSKRVQWKCKKGHGHSATITRKVAGDGCPYCSGHKVCKDNCLATLNPRLSKEWHRTKNGSLTPLNVTCGSNIKISWECGKCHFVWLARVNQRVWGTGCPACSGFIVSDKNKLSAINPEIAAEWHPTKNGPLTANDVTCCSGAKAWWKCKNCGHAWITTISYRTAGGGCPCCNKIKLKNGAICDSLPEAHYYLELKRRNIKFRHRVKVGLGKCTCDFYIPIKNTYIEVTGFSKKWKHWKTYRKGIIRKKNRIMKTLGANFEFVKIKLTKKQIQHVRENSL